MNTINIRGVAFDNVDISEALEKCRIFLETEGAKIIHTPNAEIVQMCVEKEDKRVLVNSADLIIPDGAGVILAGKILSTPVSKGKVAGIELCEKLAANAGAWGKKIFFLGGKPGIAEQAAEKLKEKYPDLPLAGCADGYFKDDGPVIEKINASGADILFVCLGVPRQEEWMNANRARLNVRLMGGFGGSFDVFAGAVKRAPKFFIKCNLEWFYRLVKEPKRIGRMMKLPKFIFGALKDKITRKKYPNLRETI